MTVYIPAWLLIFGGFALMIGLTQFAPAQRRGAIATAAMFALLPVAVVLRGLFVVGMWGMSLLKICITMLEMASDRLDRWAGGNDAIPDSTDL